MKILKDNCKSGSCILDKRGALYMNEYGWIRCDKNIYFSKMNTAVFGICMEQGREKDERN